MNLRPLLQNNQVALIPLQESDFEILYKVGSDPDIWEQHPNRNRWQKEEFEKYFEGAMLSQSAFKIIDQTTGEVIGSTRYYDYDEANDRIKIGYTFYAKPYWGTGINSVVKRLMLDYIFPFVSTVHFDIGANNIRSQIAISRLGAVKVEEELVAYYGEAAKPNFTYAITRAEWMNRLNK